MDRCRRPTIGWNIDYGYRGSAIIVALGPLPLRPINQGPRLKRCLPPADDRG